LEELGCVYEVCLVCQHGFGNAAALFLMQMVKGKDWQDVPEYSGARRRISSSADRTIRPPVIGRGQAPSVVMPKFNDDIIACLDVCSHRRKSALSCKAACGPARNGIVHDSEALVVREEFSPSFSVLEQVTRK
jgi:hypothetical protein